MTDTIYLPGNSNKIDFGPKTIFPLPIARTLKHLQALTRHEGKSQNHQIGNHLKTNLPQNQKLLTSLPAERNTVLLAKLIWPVPRTLTLIKSLMRNEGKSQTHKIWNRHTPNFPRSQKLAAVKETIKMKTEHSSKRLWMQSKGWGLM